MHLAGVHVKAARRNLAGLVYRSGIEDVPGRIGGKDRVEISKHSVPPYERLRTIFIEREPRCFAFVIDAVATRRDGYKRIREHQVLEAAGLAPQVRVNASIRRDLRPDYVCTIID